MFLPWTHSLVRITCTVFLRAITTLVCASLFKQHLVRSTALVIITHPNIVHCISYYNTLSTHKVIATSVCWLRLWKFPSLPSISLLLKKSQLFLTFLVSKQVHSKICKHYQTYRANMAVTLADCCVLTMQCTLGYGQNFWRSEGHTLQLLHCMILACKCHDRAVLMNQATIRYFSPLDEGIEMNVGQFFIKQKFKVIPWSSPPAIV